MTGHPAAEACSNNLEATMKQALLSVIAANYNNERYIRECLESILTQDYQDLEIFVHDDCSLDASPGIMREYEKKYPGKIKTMFNPVNQGVALTRHKAILEANGEYITTLDSDDYYSDPQKLQKEMALVLHHKEKTGREVIAFSNIVMVKDDKTPIKTWGNQENIKEGLILDPIMSRSCMIPRDFVMRKEVYFQAGGYDARIPIYEDWDLKIRLAAEYEFYYTGINGTAYRRHGTGLSASPIPEHIQWLEFIFKKNIHLAPETKKNEICARFNEFIEKMEKGILKNK
ncbi:MAG: glycosyltransferase family A protein [Candidatus Aminicenantes bacterium]|nr:glycosyltransferase family A protein [Candidatus Aminicenantes bacterium]